MNVIANKYLLTEKIGSGSFGTIYKGNNIRTNEDVAVKVEPISNQTKLLKNETKIYSYLTGLRGVPNVKWFGKDDENYYMVIELLGASLETLLEKKSAFSLKLIMQLGIQILEILSYIHNKGLIHRDIKPDNFLLGLGENSKHIYIIDFGFCRTYLQNGVHISENKTSSLIGTPKFASINAHNLDELSRRDDIESLGYMLIYFLLGELEWQEIRFVNYKNNNQIIKNMKMNMINEDKVPDVLKEFLIYTFSLEFNETPNYKLLIELFTKQIK
jgi:serine/threonine protein kinase